MMIIPYASVMTGITAAWILVRVMVCLHQKRGSVRRELQLLPVLICILVVTRFTLFPFFKVDGQIQPLIFDATKMYPFRINLIPFANFLNYAAFRDMLRNVIGNVAMFLPLGIVWPGVFPQLDTRWKVMAAGGGYSLLIELVQLPFYQRMTDVDDLILNSLGFLLGYGIFLLVKAVKRACRRRRGRK